MKIWRAAPMHKFDSRGVRGQLFVDHIVGKYTSMVDVTGDRPPSVSVTVPRILEPV